jgi:hypothetical protein
MCVLPGALAMIVVIVLLCARRVSQTPIDRWLGITTKQTVDRKQSRSAFVDSMDATNYFSVKAPTQ